VSSLRSSENSDSKSDEKVKEPKVAIPDISDVKGSTISIAWRLVYIDAAIAAGHTTNLHHTTIDELIESINTKRHAGFGEEYVITSGSKKTAYETRYPIISNSLPIVDILAKAIEYGTIIVDMKGLPITYINTEQ